MHLLRASACSLLKHFFVWLPRKMNKCSADMVSKHLSLGSIILLKKFGLKLTDNQQDDQSELVANTYVIEIFCKGQHKYNQSYYILGPKNAKEIVYKKRLSFKFVQQCCFSRALFLHWSLTCRVYVGEHSLGPLKICNILKYRYFFSTCIYQNRLSKINQNHCFHLLHF